MRQATQASNRETRRFQAVHSSGKAERAIASARATQPNRGRVALILSGGGNRGYFHTGVVRVLMAENLLPRVIAGSSAGSFIAALIGTRTDREVLTLLGNDAAALASPTMVKRDGRVTSATFRALVTRLIPDMTFAEAEAHSGRATNISVSSAIRLEGGLLCGPATTPDVLIRDAVLASCAIPLLFEPVCLRERRDGFATASAGGKAWIDGSFHADVPEKMIKDLYGVDHCVVSMVNPWATPFMTDPLVDGRFQHMAARLMTGMTRFAVLNWVAVAKVVTVAFPRVTAVLDTVARLTEQSYSADLVLTPSNRFADPRGLIDHPTAAVVRAFGLDGEQRTRARLSDLRALLAS